MQLGTRWKAGEPPHFSVPSALHSAIAQQEQMHPEADSWTLTWLEGRPRCALGDAALLTLDESGEATLVADFTEESGSLVSDNDDHWLN